MKKATLTIVMTLAVSSLAFAGAPIRGQIPQSATWVAHFDFEAITASAAGNGLIKLISAEDAPVPDEHVEKALALWKKLGDVKSVTLYGSSPAPTDAIVVANLKKYDKAEVMKMVGITGQSPTTAHGDHTIYTFVAKKKAPGAGLKRYGCFYSEGVIVAGADLAKVKEVLDLLDGKGKALDSNNPLTGMLTPAKGSFVVAAAVDVAKMVKAMGEATPEKTEAKGHAALLAKVQTARLEVGEVGQNLFGTIELTMATEEDAENVSMAVQGIRAIVMLQQNRKPDTQQAKDIIKLAQAIKIGAEGKTVTLQIQWPVADALSKIDAAMKRKAALKAAKEADQQP